MAQRAALLEGYRKVLAAPRCDLLRLGVEGCFVQFGPVVVCKEYLLLLAVVTDRQGTCALSMGWSMATGLRI